MRALIAGAACGIGRATCVRGVVRTGMTEGVYADHDIAAERDALVTAEDIVDVLALLLASDAGNFLGRLPGIGKVTRG